MLLQVLKKQEDIEGATHPQTLISLHNLASVLQYQQHTIAESRSLAKKLKQRREMARSQRDLVADNELLRLCEIRDTARVEAQLAAAATTQNYNECTTVVSKLIPHIPL